MGETFKFTPVAIVNIMDMMWDSSPPRANKKCQEPHTELHWTKWNTGIQVHYSVPCTINAEPQNLYQRVQPFLTIRLTFLTWKVQWCVVCCEVCSLVDCCLPRQTRHSRQHLSVTLWKNITTMCLCLSLRLPTHWNLKFSLVKSALTGAHWLTPKGHIFNFKLEVTGNICWSCALDRLRASNIHNRLLEKFKTLHFWWIYYCLAVWLASPWIIWCHIATLVVSACLRDSKAMKQHPDVGSPRRWGCIYGLHCP